MIKENTLRKQMFLYLLFALFMIILNYIIQKLNEIFIAPFVCSTFGSNEIVNLFYCSLDPFNMPEFVGSIAAVGITYIIKFFLDKYLVFKKVESNLKETSKEFLKYFAFAILTTIENIGIQFILTNFANSPLELSSFIALSIGYLTKFFLDRRYVFINPA